MNITIKNPEEIAKMRVAGKLAADVLEMIEPYVVPGVTTQALNERCHDYIVNVQQAIPAPLNYRGFPKSICTSVNHQVCHGIPSDKILKKGDIINIDITVIKDEFHGDTSKTFFVGEVTPLVKKLVRVAQECLYIGIDHVKPGVLLSQIGALIQAHAEKNHFSVVRDYCGHGIGRIFHEDPQVLHYHDKSLQNDPHAHAHFALVEGLTFTIEPMVNIGKYQVKLLADDWTVVTKDHSLSAQWEHTLLVTPTGVDVLTKRQEEHF